VEAKTESHSAQITNILSELVSLRSKMAVARLQTPCTSNSSAHSGSQLAGATSPGPKNKEADPSVIIWANPDHEIYRKQMVEECGKMLNYGIRANGEKHGARIRAGNSGKRVTIHFLNGESDANKFFQMAVKHEHTLTRCNGTVIKMRVLKDQSSVEQRNGQLINMAAKFLSETKPELGAELVREKFTGRLVYECRCALEINVNGHTLENNTDHHDAEVLETLALRLRMSGHTSSRSQLDGQDRVPVTEFLHVWDAELGLYLGLTQSMPKLNQKVFEPSQMHDVFISIEERLDKYFVNHFSGRLAVTQATGHSQGVSDSAGGEGIVV